MRKALMFWVVWLGILVVSISIYKLQPKTIEKVVIEEKEVEVVKEIIKTEYQETNVNDMFFFQILDETENSKVCRMTLNKKWKADIRQDGDGLIFMLVKP